MILTTTYLFDMQFILVKTIGREQSVFNLNHAIAFLPLDKDYQVEIKERKGTRSDLQNRYLWGVVYKTILECGQLEGWANEDIHEYMLGDFFGWEVVTGFGKKRLKPLHRSKTLNKMEFAGYIAFIQQKMAEMGVVIPDPVIG